MSTQPDHAPEPSKGRIVVIDDEANMGKILSKILSMEQYNVTAFTNPEEALEHIKRNPPDLVLTDFRMTQMTGLDVLKGVKAVSETINVIVMTAYATIEDAIDVTRFGAFDYIRKPFKTDELLLTITRALENRQLIAENQSLRETLRRQTPDTEIIGNSPAIRDVITTIEKVAPTDAAVLIRGESGTGKELVARAIHNNSLRSEKRFVAINCASIPENLLESELFGHEKGSFTGADRTKMGLVELAHGGTLFLDEIGDLPHSLQAKMLRVLQEREIQRVGGLYPIPVDIRLLAATNRDLKQAIERKEFRADLFYRLDVISVHVPPLRERTGDVPILVEFLVDKICKRLRKPTMTVSSEAVEALQQYSYPGNVRELENVMERVIVLCPCDHIELGDIPSDIRNFGGKAALPAGATCGSLDYKESKDAFEREFLLRIIDTAGGNMSEAARISGISRRHLYEKLEKLNIRMEK